MSRLWRYPLATFFAFVPILLLNIIQMLSLVIRPFSMPLFRRINTACAGIIWSWWVFILHNIVRQKVEISGDPLPLHENALVIANHQGMSDIVALLFLAKRQEMIRHLKWLVKDSLKYVPGVGWGMLFLDCIFLKRDWARDHQTITNTFATVVDGGVPLWLVCFPEGTRRTNVKQAAARKYANEHALKPTEHVLLPRPKGFAASVLGLNTHIGAVYTVGISYSGTVPTLMQLITGYGPPIHLVVRRTAAAALPSTEKDLSTWIYGAFVALDAELAQFNR